jgi:hypothetical protein
MAILKDKVPDIATVYAMDAADLPGYLLRALLSQDTRTSNVWHRQSCLGAIGDEYGSRETGCDPKVRAACAQAWQWLVLNGFIVADFERENAIASSTVKHPSRNDIALNFG